MNVDIRLKVTWYNNLKRKKLQRILGAAGPLAFIDLLLYTAMNRPTGNLTDMDEADIEIAAQWDGEKGEFVQTLVNLNFLEKKEKFYALHDWKEHNAYAAKAPERSEHARKAAKERHKQAAASRDEQCGEQKGAMRGARGEHTPSPSPSPSPLPKDSGKPDGCDKFVAMWIDLCKEMRNLNWQPTGVDVGQIKYMFIHVKGDIAEYEKAVRNYLNSEHVKMPTPAKLYANFENYRDAAYDDGWSDAGG